MVPTLLSGLIEPPAEPVETGQPDKWSEIEDRIGTVLPCDYKEYINAFGTGCLGQFVWIFNPFSSNENLNLLSQIRRQLDAIRILESQFDEKSPYPLYPDVGGLLPWGVTDNGDVLFWRTKGTPQAWNVVINEARGPRSEQYPDTLTGFVRKLIVGDIQSRIFPSNLIDRNALFTPIRNQNSE